MALTRIDITHSTPLKVTDKKRRPMLVKLGNVLLAIASGRFKATQVVVTNDNNNAVAASGTVTLASASGSLDIVINGVTINRTWATSDTATAAAFAADINASANALVSGFVTASASGGVITITAANAGKLGNAITYSVSGTNISHNPSTRLAGGSNATGSTGQTISV